MSDISFLNNDSYNNSPLVAKFISIAFAARTLTHFEHLSTNSYAKHIALNEFYSGIVDLVDKFVESHQGVYGVITMYPDTITKFSTNDSGKFSIGYLSNWISQNRKNPQFPQDTSLQNILDEIVDLCNTTLYKINNLS